MAESTEIPFRLSKSSKHEPLDQYVLREVCRGCRLRTFFFNGPAELRCFFQGWKSPTARWSLCRWWCDLEFAQSTLKKDPFVFFEDIGCVCQSALSHTNSWFDVFFCVPIMDVVANLRILIRGLGQCMVSQTLRMHISRFLRPVEQRAFVGMEALNRLLHASWCYWTVGTYESMDDFKTVYNLSWFW